MKSDFLTSGAVDRSQPSTLQYKAIRGTHSHLLLTNSTSWHYKDVITVKLRHAAGNTVVVDRIPALVLALLTDLKQGFPTTGTPDYIGDAGADGENNQGGGYVYINAGVRVVINAILLPLGHITLSGKDELEITVECAKQELISPATMLPTGRVNISSISDKTRIDTLYCYEITSDLEVTLSNVRELYLAGKKGVSFFNAIAGAQNSPPVAKDVKIKLGIDGDDSETDVETCGALTAISCQLTAQPSNLLLLLKDYDSVPATVYTKVYGEDKDMTQILVIREMAIPHLVGESIKSGFDKELRRVESFEQTNPDAARALQQTGKIASSETMKIAADNFMPAVQVK